MSALNICFHRAFGFVGVYMVSNWEMTKTKKKNCINKLPYPRHPGPPPEVRYDWTPKTYALHVIDWIVSYLSDIDTWLQPKITLRPSDITCDIPRFLLRYPHIPFGSTKRTCIYCLHEWLFFMSNVGKEIFIYIYIRYSHLNMRIFK